MLDLMAGGEEIERGCVRFKFSGNISYLILRWVKIGGG